MSSKPSFSGYKTMIKPGTNGNKFKYLLERLFRDFDKGLNIQLEKNKRQLNSAIDKLNARIDTIDIKLKKHTNTIIAYYENELNFANGLVNKELRAKVLLSQWSNKFLSLSTFQDLDPVTYAYTRFSLNICLCYSDVPPEYFIKAKVHNQLATYLTFSNEIVVGPALMAMVHLSLLPIMKPIMVDIGILPTLLNIFVHSNSRIIIAQVCKLLASLALHFVNKSFIVNSGCLHGIIDMILGHNKEWTVYRSSVTTSAIGKVDLHTQLYALAALINVIHGSDANRVLAVELNAIPPVIAVLRSAGDSEVIYCCAAVLANISFNNSFSGGCILAQAGDTAIQEALISTDIFKEPKLVYVLLAAIANLCTSEANQSHLGSTAGLIDTAVRICENARETYLSMNAAKLLLGLMWKNLSNKAKVSKHGGCAVLLKRIIRHCNSLSIFTTTKTSQHHNDLGQVEDTLSDEDNVHVECVEYACMALSSMLLVKTAHPRLNEIGGIEELIRICKKSSNPRILRSISMIITTMVPSPEELRRFHEEENIIDVEKYNALPVLKKIRIQGFGHLPSPPIWLETAVSILTMSNEALSLQPPWEKQEFVEPQKYMEEFLIPINPDAEIMDSGDLRGFLFSLY